MVDLWQFFTLPSNFSEGIADKRYRTIVFHRIMDDKVDSRR